MSWTILSLLLVISLPINVNKKVDWIFHCAAVTTSKLMIEKPVETLSTAIEGTKNILELARKNKCKSRYIFHQWKCMEHLIILIQR